MSKIPVSLQLYSLRAATRIDFASTVAEVARIGYTGVETAGFGNLDAAGAARAIADAGLKCSGMHVGLQALRTDLDRVMAEAALFGTADLICPSSPRQLLRSPRAFAAIGAELDAIGARLRSFGFQLHYHNHDFEIVSHEGRLGLDHLLDAARPAHLLAEADVYWLQVGGKDPSAFLREQGRRVRLIHVKDEKELGTGPVDFPAVFAAAESIGAVTWYVVEVEAYNFEPIESVRRSFEYLRGLGRA